MNWGGSSPGLTNADVASQVAAVVPPVVSSSVAAQLPDAIKPLLPIPTYRINVLGAGTVVMSSQVFCVLVDRKATLSTFAFLIDQLGGVNATLTLKLTKNGADIPAAVIAVTTAGVPQVFPIPGSVSVDAGDRIRGIISGVSVGLSWGDLAGYIRTV